MYRISFYVPADAAEEVKQAMFRAGAGRIGRYDHCAWETAGRGQFRPLEGSRPVIGRQDHVESLEELRVEMVCEDGNLTAALSALVDAHPYEEPAYGAVKIITLGE